MKNEYYLVREALVMMKAGYHLEAKIDRQVEDFYFNDDHVYVLADNKVIKINEYEFLDLYGKTSFQLADEQNDEETIDMKKDEEYYSWRQ
jgi:hypothetical protein